MKKNQTLIIGLLILSTITVIIVGGNKFNNSIIIKNASTQIVEEKPKSFSDKIENGDKINVVFLGDSTTEQNHTTDGKPNHVDLFTKWFNEEYPKQVRVYNAGMSGNNITQMKNRVNKDVLSHKPDLVVISSGLNDQGGTGTTITVEEFKRNYDMLIKEILATGECDIILRTPNITQTPETNKLLNPYVNAVKELSSKHNVGLFDLFRKMQDDVDSNEVALNKLMYDNVHPNEKGQQFIFNNFKPYMEREINKE